MKTTILYYCRWCDESFLKKIIPSDTESVPLYTVYVCSNTGDQSCLFVQVNHLEPWEKGSRKTAGQTGMCGGVSIARNIEPYVCVICDSPASPVQNDLLSEKKVEYFTDSTKKTIPVRLSSSSMTFHFCRCCCVKCKLMFESVGCFAPF